MNLRFIELIRVNMDRSLRMGDPDTLEDGHTRLVQMADRTLKEPARLFGPGSELNYELREMTSWNEAPPSDEQIAQAEIEYADLTGDMISTVLSPQLRGLSEYAKFAATLTEEVGPEDTGSWIGWLDRHFYPLVKRDLSLDGLEWADFWIRRFRRNLWSGKPFGFDFVGRLDGLEGYVTDEWDFLTKAAEQDSPALVLFGLHAQWTQTVFSNEINEYLDYLVESTSLAKRLTYARTGLSKAIFLPIQQLMKEAVTTDQDSANVPPDYTDAVATSETDENCLGLAEMILSFSSLPSAGGQTPLGFADAKEAIAAFTDFWRDRFDGYPPPFALLLKNEGRFDFFADLVDASGVSAEVIKRVAVTPDDIFANIKQLARELRGRVSDTESEYDALDAIEHAEDIYALLADVAGISGYADRFARFDPQAGADGDLARIRGDILYFTREDIRRDSLANDLIPPEQAYFSDQSAHVIEQMQRDAVNPIHEATAAALSAGDKAALDTMKAHLNALASAAAGAGTGLPALIAKKIAVWPALRGAQGPWRRLARDGRYPRHMQAIVGKCAEFVDLCLRALATVAVVIPSIYRCIDQSVSKGDSEKYARNHTSVEGLRSADALIAFSDRDTSDLGPLKEIAQEPLKEIAASPKLMEFYQDEFDEALSYSKSHRSFLEKLDETREHLAEIGGQMAGLIGGGRGSDYTRADVDACLCVHFDFLKNIANAPPAHNVALTTLIEPVKPEDLPAVEALKSWNDTVIDAYGADIMALAHSQRVRTKALKSCVRRVFAAQLEDRIRLTRNVDNDNSHDFATLETAALFLDAERDYIEYATFTSEWPAAIPRRWEHVWERNENVDLHALRVRQVVESLTDFQNAWFDDGRSLQDISAEMATSKADEEFQVCARVLAAAEPYIAAYCIEQIPAFLREVSGMTGTPKSAPGFVESHTVDFRFHNELGEAKLSSLVAQEMILELINPLDEELALGEPRPAPVPDEDLQDTDKTQPDCHFILRFRRGALDDVLDNVAVVGPRTSKGGWQIVGRRRVTYDAVKVDELLLLGPRELVFRPGQSRHLILTEMQGAGGDTRTTRVLLLHQGLEDRASGSREKLLSVVNDIPRNTRQVFELPLNVEFVKPELVTSDPADFLRNDGITFNKLKIAITSVVPMNHRTPVVFSRFRHFGQTASGTGRDTFRRTKIILSIDTVEPNFGQEKDWAMCTNSQAAAIRVDLQGADRAHRAWEMAFTSQGTRAEWIFTLPGPASYPEDALILPRNKSLMLEMSHIQSKLPSGPCNLYVTCQNFPGFPDRTFHLKAMKTAGDVPAGTIIAYAGRQQPPGWLFCIGQDVPDGEDYAALRAARFDPENPTETPKIPNLVARTIIGAGAAAGRKNFNGSEAFPSAPADTPLSEPFDRRDGLWETPLERANLPQHSHNDAATWNDSAGWIANDAAHNGRALVSGGLVNAPPEGEKAGTPHINFQPYHALNYIIKI